MILRHILEDALIGKNISIHGITGEVTEVIWATVPYEPDEVTLKLLTSKGEINVFASPESKMQFID